MALFDKFTALAGARDSLLEVGANPFDVRMERIRSATEAVIEGRDVILFGTNNYLGLTFDAGCIEAAQAAVACEGTGTTGCYLCFFSFYSIFLCVVFIEVVLLFFHL